MLVDTTVFKRALPKGERISPFRLPFRYLKTLLSDGITPIRAISDVAIREYLPYLHGKGPIYEIGAATPYYKAFVPADQEYILTDMNPKIEHNVDMTNMQYEDSSIDAFVSIFSLEHIPEYRKGISEVYRTLKPGGRFLLVVPFMYCFHAAPDDYVRFTPSYLRYLLKDFNVASIDPLGSRGLYVAEMYHEKKFMRKSTPKWLKIIYRLFAALFVLRYIVCPVRDDAFPSAVVALVEKPVS